MRRLSFPFWLLALTLLVAFAFSGCTPRRIGASSQFFSASGRPDLSVAVASPLTLAATGWLSANVPADVIISPLGTFRYALFVEGNEGPVTRQVHVIFSELPRNAWRWEMETWARPEALDYEKFHTAGKYWTVQTLALNASSDWFTSLWVANKRQTPDFWLARRWSATPEENTRVVVEYREPAPMCLRPMLMKITQRGKDAPLMHGRELRHGCKKELKEFSARAENSVTLDRAQPLPGEPLVTRVILPSSAPDMGKLAGRAELVDRGNDRLIP